MPWAVRYSVSAPAGSLPALSSRMPSSVRARARAARSPVVACSTRLRASAMAVTGANLSCSTVRGVAAATAGNGTTCRPTAPVTGVACGGGGILFDLLAVMDSGPLTTGGAGAADGVAASSGEAESRAAEGVMAAGRVCVVRGKVRGGGAATVRGGRGGVFAASMVWEDRAELGRGGGRLAGTALAGALVGASLARTGSDTGAGVASMSSRSLLSSSSLLASSAGASGWVAPSSLSGLRAVSSSGAPVMIFLWPRTSPRVRLRLTRRVFFRFARVHGEARTTLVMHPIVSNSEMASRILVRDTAGRGDFAKEKSHLAAKE
jgi:hypothetical protein